MSKLQNLPGGGYPWADPQNVNYLEQKDGVRDFTPEKVGRRNIIFLLYPTFYLY